MDDNEFVGVRSDLARNLSLLAVIAWKDWIIVQKTFCAFIFLGVPTVLFLSIFRTIIKASEHETIIFDPFCAASPVLDAFPKLCDLRTETLDAYRNLPILFAPKNNQTEKIMSSGFFAQLPSIGFSSTEELEAHYNRDDNILAALTFDEIRMGQDVTVEIRLPSELREISDVDEWPTNELWPVTKQRGPRMSEHSTGGTPSYNNETFLAIQEFVTVSIIALQKGDTSSMENVPFIHIRRFPHHKWNDDIFFFVSSFPLPILLIGFFMNLINVFIISITKDKENQLKQLLKIMGLSTLIHWLGWFIRCFILSIVAVIAFVGLIKFAEIFIPNVAPNSNEWIVLLFFVINIFPVITFSFAMSCFFNHVDTVAIYAGYIILMSLLPYIITNQMSMHVAFKILGSLSFSTAFCYGVQTILSLEKADMGIHWDLLFSRMPDDTLPLGWIFVILIVDSLLYLLLALYIESIYPGEYGVPKPWNFFWKSRTRQEIEHEGVDVAAQSEKLSPFLDKEPSNLRAGVQIKNLYKKYGKHMALDNLSFNAFENQVTILLGHNGAGKTTTLSVLTGMIPATSGTVLVNGFDIRTDMKSVRSILGVCPQKDILFEDLTVKQNLTFFCKLKGLKHEYIEDEVKKYIGIVGLQLKKKRAASKLSGGDKRKLCVAIALSAFSKIVILDEPSSGMDPMARRNLWEIISNQKEGRTIIMTTHSMEEADSLGDRIAIMASGKMKCCGSSFFLKKKYSTGYKLILEKGPGCNVDKVRSFLQKHIPEIRIHQNVGSELAFILPDETAPMFEYILSDLEQNRKDLDILALGVSLTSLEEVFLKVAVDEAEDGNIRTTKNNYDSRVSASTSRIQLFGKCRATKMRFLAMMWKKIYMVQSRKILYLIIFLLSAILMLTPFVMHYLKKTGFLLPPLDMKLDIYDEKKPIVLIESDDDNNIYKQNFETLSGSFSVEIVDDIIGKMLDLTSNVKHGVRERYLVGASFKSGTSSKRGVITAWFNNNPYHSAPISVAMVLNAVYQSLLGTKSEISFINHPLPYKNITQVKRKFREGGLCDSIISQLNLIESLTAAFFVTACLSERLSKIKHLQILAGTDRYLYWSATYIFDMLVFAFLHFVLVIIIIPFQVHGFYEAEDLGRIFLLMVVFGFSVLPFVYFFSFLCFANAASGFTVVFFITMMVSMLMKFLNTHTLAEMLKVETTEIFWYTLAFPYLALTEGLNNNYKMTSYNNYCRTYFEACEISNDKEFCTEFLCTNMSEFCCKDYFDFSHSGISYNIIYMLGFGLAFILLIMLIEYKLRKMHCTCPKKPKPVEDEDVDVAKERLEIEKTNEKYLRENYAIVLKKLTKYYGKFLAVNGVSVAINHNECFGLLGLNGAGKTTTFKMLTGALKMSHGKVWVLGNNIRNRQPECGYCPQFDGLLNEFTVRKTLKIFGMIRGLSKQRSEVTCEKFAEELQFSQHLDKRISQLSGGTKKKVSTAVALIGDPEIIYLDEPTTGMDPISRRHTWNAICAARDRGACIILTTHTMEECEALCTRIVIMVNGYFKCLGSIQHLKSKFAESYILTVKVGKDENNALNQKDVKDVERFVEKRFKRSKLKEIQEDLMVYELQDTSVAWSTMFGIMERARTDLNIEDYSLGQLNLEQIFITFTKKQAPENK